MIGFLALVTLVSWLLPSSIEAGCLDTECQLNSFKGAKGCEQYVMRETKRRKCPGGLIYSCCDIEEDTSGVVPAVAASNACWDTPCQLSTWPVRGCEQYSQIMAKTRTCPGGRIYTCCDPLDGGSKPETPPGATISCGVVNTATALILSGSHTARGLWPWHVALYLKSGEDEPTAECGATLVSKSKVITAAHCVTTQTGKKIDPKTVSLRFGKHTLSEDEEGSLWRQVKSIAIPPAYNYSSYFADLAVLTLSENVEYSVYIRPACLFEPDNDIANIIGKEGTVVGWGVNELNFPADTLQLAKAPVVSMKACVDSYPQFFSRYATDGNFCAGLRNGTSPCKGDSGGGLVFNRHSVWYLRGVVSFSVNKREVCSTQEGNFYTVYTDLSRFPNFLKKHL